jgi:hypothetical protein
MQEVLEDTQRANVLARVETRLDPETPLDEEKQIAEHWSRLQPSPAPGDYEAKLAKRWWQIGCLTDDASYVLAGLIRKANSFNSPFSPDTVQVSQLAADFLKDDCAGAHGLSEDAKANLRTLRDRVAQKPANPSAQGPRP